MTTEEREASGGRTTRGNDAGTSEAGRRPASCRERSHREELNWEAVEGLEGEDEG